MLITVQRALCHFSWLHTIPWQGPFIIHYLTGPTDGTFRMSITFLTGSHTRQHPGRGHPGLPGHS